MRSAEFGERPCSSNAQIFGQINQCLLQQLVQYLEIDLNAIILNLNVLDIAVIGNVVRVCGGEMMIPAAEQSRKCFYNCNGLWC